MSKLQLSVIFTGLILLVLMVSTAACAGKNDADKSVTGNDDESGGRIVVPDADWEKAKQDDSVDEDSGDNNGSDDSDTENGDNSDDIRENIVPGGRGEAPERIKIELYIDDVLQPIDVPVNVYENIPIKAEFHITGLDTNLEAYEIKSAAMPDAPRVDRLEGTSAVIPYIFTYNSKTWGDWGIAIMVKSVDGDMVSRNWVIGKPSTEGPGSR